MVGEDGAVKALDFGLAKLMGHEAAPEDETATLTANVDLSAPATIAGTAAYMSPEQPAGAYRALVIHTAAILWPLRRTTSLLSRTSYPCVA